MNAFQPSSNLLLTAQGPDSARFVLASQSWLDLQSRVQGILNLPSDMGEYAARYGDPSSGMLMKECFDAMRHLRQTVERYGSPTSLRAKVLSDPGFLAQKNRPQNDAFAATVWTMERAHRDAFMLSSTLRSIPQIAMQESSVNATAGIKSLFVDSGQILDNMHETIGQLDTLITQFQQMEAALAQAQEQMRSYTDRSSTTRTELDKEIGALGARIEQLERDRDNAYSKWLALTISACVVPAVLGIVGAAIMIVLALPTAGSSLAIGTAITAGSSGAAATALGIAASNARTSYDNILTDLQGQSEMRAKRSAYCSDLTALDSLMKFSLPSSNDIITQLRSVRDGWTGSATALREQVSELTARTLHTSAWSRSGEMDAASANWMVLDESLKAFMTGAFIDADVMNFGVMLPPDQHDWQQNFMQKRAA